MASQRVAQAKKVPPPPFQLALKIQNIYQSLNLESQINQKGFQ